MKFMRVATKRTCPQRRMAMSCRPWELTFIASWQFLQTCYRPSSHQHPFSSLGTPRVARRIFAKGGPTPRHGHGAVSRPAPTQSSSTPPVHPRVQRRATPLYSVWYEEDGPACRHRRCRGATKAKTRTSGARRPRVEALSRACPYRLRPTRVGTRLTIAALSTAPSDTHCAPASPR
ncbi:hypothetical protein B0H12DRAFT_309340 [Mycena haematopus]|nr:hypothetical protein B0H12DRAFT_309340 [Mycena haematopus]